MANYFRTTSSMLARIETLTKELLGATPYGELNDGLGVSSGIIKRLAHEMQSKDIQLEKYLMLEKRVATQLRETRAIAKEMRMLYKTSSEQAREYVILRAKEDHFAGMPEQEVSPARTKKPTPEPDGYTEKEATELMAQMKEVTASMDRGEVPADPDLTKKLMDFSERTSDRAFKDVKGRVNGQAG
ncbi:MAG: hypothetical protein V3V10_04895 [Planctomycetota bacterium]